MRNSIPSLTSFWRTKLDTQMLKEERASPGLLSVSYTMCRLDLISGRIYTTAIHLLPEQFMCPAEDRHRGSHRLPGKTVLRMRSSLTASIRYRTGVLCEFYLSWKSMMDSDTGGSKSTARISGTARRNTRRGNMLPTRYSIRRGWRRDAGLRRCSNA